MGGVGGAATLAPARSGVRRDVDLPTPPFYGSRVVEGIDPDDVYPYINESALFKNQWQFRQGAKDRHAFRDEIEEKARPVYNELKERCRAEGILQPRVVYGYFPAASCGDDLIVYDPEDHDREIERFTFPRQRSGKLLCISDFFRDVDECRRLGRKDVLGVSCVTMGRRVSEATRRLFEGGDYQQYLFLHGLGVEAAEGLAELWHKRMRQELGIAGDDSHRIRDLFTQKYRGSRYSFGYPACPEMSDQERIWRLIDPTRIGCELTENWQIDPEQSTSALVVHHPEAKYFNA